ncbi:MAG: SGNH/GDSL hydrolase family protein [Planctomycetes bacterium]|nr:SGNH/GDSL hydrolase family protein [Planctomycetota bacterium]
MGRTAGKMIIGIRRCITRDMGLPAAVAFMALLALDAGALEKPGKKKADPDYWVEPMKKVHAAFKGEKKTFAHFGDSITDTRAFWTGLQWQRNNMSPEALKAYNLVRAHMAQKCWGDWKGPRFGNQSRQTATWAQQNVDGWLGDLKPECVLIMFGTNDLATSTPETYARQMTEIVQKCLNSGAVVILSTIPPRHERDEIVQKYVGAVRKLAADSKVPLIDFYQEVITRRPKDWDGALPQFAQYNGYDVPTLISRDGVHPSNPGKYNGDYSDEGLRSNGYTLRNYLVLMKYAEVIEKVLSK